MHHFESQPEREGNPKNSIDARNSAPFTKKGEIQSDLEPIIALLKDLQSAIELVERYGSKVERHVAVDRLRDFRSSLKLKRQHLEAFVPLPRSIDTLADLADTPEDAASAIGLIEEGVDGIPEPTEQDAARDYLTVGQERLETVREASARLQEAQEQARLARTVSEAYASASTTVLEQVYKEVEREFMDLYRFINRADEGNFEARLIPSMGKLGFDVDFYGRGFFPPGAYHSEGHQDSMGVCLYLALMRHLMGDSFDFAVLDDVLMSVDAGHRREVCTLLKEHFPNTQLILTTHDEIWLMHMKTAGLVESQAAVHFSEWDVDHGPSKWENRDVWEEIGEHLKKNDVRAAAALLRHYLEYISRELCHRLRASVVFRGDARYDLGDLLPSATSRFKKLLGEGQQVSKSWNNEVVLNEITERRLAFEAALARKNLESWQINPAIHYNEWKDFNR